MLLDWFNRLEQAALTCDSDAIFVLGREGWSIVPLFNNLNAMRGGTGKRFVYLQTSRALLTHITLSDPDMHDFGFNVTFEGSVRQFFEDRLGLHYGMLRLPAISEHSVRLPRDREFLLDLYRPNADRAIAHSAASRNAYRTYLDRLGFTTSRRQVISDLGFRGTSQALLSALYGHDISGFYAMMDPAGPGFPLKLDRSRATGLFVNDQTFGSGYPPLEGSLLFEAFLTAPFGQTSGIQDAVMGDPFLYRDGSTAQKNFAIIAECFQGAQKFTMDHSDLIGSRLPLIDDFLQFFESFKAAIASNLSIFGDILEVDDSFFGHNLLNAEVKL